jgi:hypothetical protein
VSDRALVEFRDRLRTRPGFRLHYTDPDTEGVRVRDFEIAEHPAGVWIGALFSDEAADLLLDVLAEDDARWVWELVTDPEESLDESGCHRIGRALLTRVAGRPWWEATRLLSTYVHERHTFDWVEYRLLSGQAKDVDRRALQAQIQAPPLDEEVVSGEWDDEELAADWLEVAGPGG